MVSSGSFSRLLSTLLLSLSLSLSASTVRADLTTGIPDSAPAGYEEWTSSIVQPAKNVSGDGDWASAVAKAKAFVAGLTLEEQVNLTTGTDTTNRCVGNTGEVTRLGFRGFCLQDSPLGVRDTDYASAFPAGINVAATWDKDLIYARGKAMGEEHRGKGVNVALGPMTNLGRVAAGGRNWEGFGADPYLSGVASRETINGIQDTGVIACVKHYIGNEQEHFRGGSESAQVYSSDIDDRTLHELYAWPFAEAVNAGVGSVMCSYNYVNQTQTCQNSKIIAGVLKEELDFQGFVVSDWAAMINGVQTALAGTDMNMPGFIEYGDVDEPNPDTTNSSWWGSNLIEAVNNGSVPAWRVADMVTRTMAAYYKMGQDDPSYPEVNFSYLTEETELNGVVVNEHVNVQGDHYKVIREIDAASTILLKNNNNTLPLNVNNIKRIGIFGSDAGPNPDGPNGCPDRNCDQGTLAMGWGSGTANFPYLIDPLSAIQNYIHSQDPTTVIEGILSDFNYDQIGSVASVADTCLAFVNADSGEGYITVYDNDGNNVGDRKNLTLWHGGEDLIATVAGNCSNTIVVMHIVGPVLVEDWIDHPNVTAVLHAGLPGQESGNGLVDVLFGAVNPSGKLPYTIAKQRSDYPADVLYESNMTTPQIVYSEALEIDYRWFDAQGIEPRFPFGFGLSYTTFEYNGLNIVPTSADSTSNSTRRRRDDVDAMTTATSSDATSVSTPTLMNETSAIPTATATSSLSISAPNATTFTATATTSSFVGNITSIPISISASATSTSNTSTSTSSAPPAISSPAQTNPGGSADLFETIFEVTYAISNVGSVDGYEVSQLYLAFPESAGEPPRVLRGFERTWVAQGQTTNVKLEVRKKDVAVWDVVNQVWSVPQGAFTVQVGASSRDLRLNGTVVPSDWVQ